MYCSRHRSSIDICWVVSRSFKPQALLHGLQMVSLGEESKRTPASLWAGTESFDFAKVSTTLANPFSFSFGSSFLRNLSREFGRWPLWGFLHEAFKASNAGICSTPQSPAHEPGGATIGTMITWWLFRFAQISALNNFTLGDDSSLVPKVWKLLLARRHVQITQTGIHSCTRMLTSEMIATSKTEGSSDHWFLLAWQEAEAAVGNPEVACWWLRLKLSPSKDPCYGWSESVAEAGRHSLFLRRH